MCHMSSGSSGRNTTVPAPSLQLTSRLTSFITTISSSSTGSQFCLSKSTMELARDGPWLQSDGLNPLEGDDVAYDVLLRAFLMMVRPTINH